MTALLSHALLEELDERLARFQPWERALLEPGLPEEKIKETLASIGLQAPGEAYTWWSWRTAPVGPPDPKIGGFFALSPAGAVREYVSLTKIYADGAEREEKLWPRYQLPFLKEIGGGVLCFSCTEAGATHPGIGKSSTITMLSAHDYGEPPTAASLRLVVSWWIECFDTGIYISEAVEERLVFDRSRIPAERIPFV